MGGQASTMNLLLKNGKVFLNGELQNKDILIESGRIKEISENLTPSESTHVENISEKIVLPGVIDAHVHFREPGHPHKEDFLSGSKAAAAGGVTTIFDMPNNSPPIISQGDVENKKELAKKSIVNYGLYVGATPENILNLNDVKDVVGIKVYMGSSTGNLLVDKVADFVRLIENTNKLVVVHSENEELIKYFSEKYGHTKMHHQMRDNLAAAISTSYSVIAANYFKKNLHIAHMTTKEEVELLRKFKTPNITCEVCPHHLFLNSKFFKEKGNYGKMNPPLRSEEDRKALWQGIKEGIIDMISTDHAPHLENEKEVEFEQAPCGVPGVQTTLPLMLNEVNNGNLELKDVVRLCSENPARRFKLESRGEIKEGNYADFVIVDMKKTATVTNDEQYSKCAWTPFHGRELKGWPVMTIVNGNIVFKDNKVFEDHKGVLVDIL
jgi:dihydroorotase